MDMKARDAASRRHQFYIDGRWTEPQAAARIPVVDPATEREIASIAGGNADDVARAVACASRAFAGYSITPKRERVALLERLLKACEGRRDAFAQALCREVGIPIGYARDVQTESALEQLRRTIRTLETYDFERRLGSTLVVREAIGVVGMITPWNWPLVQIICKVAPALAAGCTMVLKPSELAPLTALTFAEAVDEAEVPAGVFNLINGDGPSVGEALATHPEIAMVSFTGSTVAGVRVAKLAADTVKRVTQELGGKSPCIVLPDADVARAVQSCVQACFANNGQTCDAPTRLFVPSDVLELAEEAARAACAAYVIGAPQDAATSMGPLVNARQFERVQGYISAGLAEGARLIAGGPGRPEHVRTGYFVRPTVFSGVSPDMRIAREEIFGPVLSILSYEDVGDAIRMANDTEFGLAAYVHGKDRGQVLDTASRMRAGTVYINDPDYDLDAPFGGYKHSGNGREYGTYGLEEYLETKSMVGYIAG